MTNEKALHHSSIGPRSSGWTVAAAVAIVVAVVAAYSNSFNGPFIFDDLSSIQDNKTIRNLRSVEILASDRPLTNLSLAVNYAIGKLDVRSYHVVNLLIHLLAALALFGIVRRTLLLPALRPDSGQALRDRFGRASTGLATAVALIWALHPLQTESVTYIVQRAESLMGLCYLLTLYAVLRGATSERPRPWYAAAVAVCALGMGAKEVMATAPIVVLLYDRAFLAGSFRETFRRRGALYLGLAATWAVLAAILLLCKESPSAGFGIKAFTPWQYALTQPGVILYYLGLSFWPRSLCFDYSWPLATKFWQIVPEAIALAALLAATAWAVVRRRPLGFLGAWFFLILAPTSSIMPIDDACFEHRMYLSLAAVVAGAVIAACALIRRLVRQSACSDHSATIAAAALALVVAVALGCATFRRNQDYRTAVSIWEDTVRKRENNARAQSSLGVTYFGEGRFDEAMRCYNRAIELKPEYADAHYNRGTALARINDHAGAIREYDEAISLQPDFAVACVNRGVEYFKTNRLSEAVQDFNRAIELKPDVAEAFFNRARAYIIGFHRYDLALPDLNRAIELKPDFVEAFFNRANTYIGLHRYDLALPDCNRAIKLKPGYAAAWETRAIVYFQMKEYDKSWQNVAASQKLGGQPDPRFLQALKQASGRSE